MKRIALLAPLLALSLQMFCTPPETETWTYIDRVDFRSASIYIAPNSTLLKSSTATSQRNHEIINLQGSNIPAGSDLTTLHITMQGDTYPDYSISYQPFLTPYLYYLTIPRQDGTLLSVYPAGTHIDINTITKVFIGGFLYGSLAGSAAFPLNFNDPTLSSPESHVYTLEFWECLGPCNRTDYDRKTVKKDEISVTVVYTP